MDRRQKQRLERRWTSVESGQGNPLVIDEHRHRLPCIGSALRLAPPRLTCLMSHLEVPSEIIPRGGHAINPSVLRTADGNLTVSMRLYIERERRSWLALAKLDERTWRLRDVRVCEDRSGGPRHPGMSTGVEDGRLFALTDGLHMSASVSDRVENDRRPKIGIVDFTRDGHIGAVHLQPSRRMEKNWMPFADNSGRLVYTPDPLTILQYSGETKRVEPLPTAVSETETGVLRGGSQLIEFDDGWLGLVHQAHTPSTQTRDKYPIYLQRFIFLPKEADSFVTSNPFCMTKLGIEFGSGMAATPQGVVITFGIDDDQKGACFALVQREVISETFVKEPVIL